MRMEGVVVCVFLGRLLFAPTLAFSSDRDRQGKSDARPPALVGERKPPNHHMELILFISALPRTGQSG